MLFYAVFMCINDVNENELFLKEIDKYKLFQKKKTCNFYTTSDPEGGTTFPLGWREQSPGNH